MSDLSTIESVQRYLIIHSKVSLMANSTLDIKLQKYGSQYVNNLKCYPYHILGDF